ncbi:unnamed protein product [Amoebophrya sp. A25]|nr:unnamed protein product [Amoebophrya sp. A25]|eukprot:GSA25T00007101001.1
MSGTTTAVGVPGGAILAQAEEMQQGLMEEALGNLLESNQNARRISQALPAQLSTAEKMFRCLDVDQNGLLGRDEMRVFAIQTGFEEDDPEGPDWDTAYLQLCASFGVDPELGLEMEIFDQLCEQYLQEECYRESIDQFVCNNYFEPVTRRKTPGNSNKSRAGSRHSSVASARRMSGQWSVAGSRRNSVCSQRSRRDSVGSLVSCAEGLLPPTSRRSSYVKGAGPGSSRRNSRRNSGYNNLVRHYDETPDGDRDWRSRAGSRTSVCSNFGAGLPQMEGGQDSSIVTPDKRTSQRNSDTGERRLSTASRASRRISTMSNMSSSGGNKNKQQKRTRQRHDPEFADNVNEHKEVRKLKKYMREILQLEAEAKAGKKLEDKQKMKVLRKEGIAVKIKEEQNKIKNSEKRRSLVAASRRASKALAGEEMEGVPRSRRSSAAGLHTFPGCGPRNSQWATDAEEFVPGQFQFGGRFQPQQPLTREELLVAQYKEAEQAVYFSMLEMNQKVLTAWRNGGSSAVRDLHTYSPDNPYATMNQTRPKDPNHWRSTGAGVSAFKAAAAKARSNSNMLAPFSCAQGQESGIGGPMVSGSNGSTYFFAEQQNTMNAMSMATTSTSSVPSQKTSSALFKTTSKTAVPMNVGGMVDAIMGGSTPKVADTAASEDKKKEESAAAEKKADNDKTESAVEKKEGEKVETNNKDDKKKPFQFNVDAPSFFTPLSNTMTCSPMTSMAAAPVVLNPASPLMQVAASPLLSSCLPQTFGNPFLESTFGTCQTSFHPAFSSTGVPSVVEESATKATGSRSTPASSSTSSSITKKGSPSTAAAAKAPVAVAKKEDESSSSSDAPKKLSYAATLGAAGSPKAAPSSSPAGSKGKSSSKGSGKTKNTSKGASASSNAEGASTSKKGYSSKGKGKRGGKGKEGKEGAKKPSEGGPKKETPKKETAPKA